MSRVVEPLRSELVEKVMEQSGCPDQRREFVGLWVDMVCTAIDECLEEHGGVFASCGLTLKRHRRAGSR